MPRRLIAPLATALMLATATAAPAQDTVAQDLATVGALILLKGFPCAGVTGYETTESDKAIIVSCRERPNRRAEVRYLVVIDGTDVSVQPI